MTSSSKRKEESHLLNGGVKQSTWSKAFNSNAVWEEKDEFLDVIYWLRQIIAIILGVIWGVAPLKGFLGIAIFCIINAGVLYVYFSSFQQIDEEEYGGTWELTKEGFMTSFALFLVPPFVFAWKPKMFQISRWTASFSRSSPVLLQLPFSLCLSSPR
ncbi:uncharacterized protein RAB5IF isoform X1 [Solea solea]|uniref:uncharacterized protein RAB5IF isoform X1 n=1 Tax=Solea solea TaxID=90069 RepID=UPI00272D2660|nr:uncharacterized protein RAB5IF isoform X1 [Solea solea]